MMHPDPRFAEAFERSARDVARATQAPPTDLPDTPAAYIAWLHARTAPVRPSTRRTQAQWLNPDPYRRKGPRGRVAPDERSPAYAAAEARLRRLPDLGAASLEAARVEHPGWPVEQLVMHAAAHPVLNAPEQNGTGLNGSEHPGTAAPTCDDCGTALDPDGCWTCTTTTNGATQ